MKATLTVTISDDMFCGLDPDRVERSVTISSDDEEVLDGSLYSAAFALREKAADAIQERIATRREVAALAKELAIVSQAERDAQEVSDEGDS